MESGPTITWMGGLARTGRARRALVEEDALFVLVAGLAATALPAVLVAWLVDRLTRPDGASDS